MSYFLAPQRLRAGEPVRLEGEEAGHLLKSRRLRSGDTFALQDPDGQRFLAEVVQVERHAALVRPIQPVPIPALPPVRLSLLLGAVKDKALELTLQKATELGVALLDIFPTRYSPVAAGDLTAARTVTRWERILQEACKQSDRQFPPELRMSGDLDAALRAAGGAALRLVLDPRGEEAATALADCAGAASAAVLVGPEGGLSPEEVALARGAGFRSVRLGELILRAETAAIAAAAVVLLGTTPAGR